MSNRRRVGWIVIAALLGFSCAPVLSPSLIPTLDPSSLSTAIALTADAASVQTVAVSQPILATPAVAMAGPTLDSNSLNTMIAQTAGAAATQTAGMIPRTLTPSITPFPTWTPTIVPSSTPTFLLSSLVTATKPKGSNPKGKPTPTHKVTVEPPPPPVIKFQCRVVDVAPANNSVIAPNTPFKAYWTVKNTGEHHWQKDSLDIIYDGGTIPHLTFGYDFSPYQYVPSGYTVPLPGVDLIAPSSPGTYTTMWKLHIAKISFCPMQLTIIVQ